MLTITHSAGQQKSTDVKTERSAIEAINQILRKVGVSTWQTKANYWLDGINGARIKLVDQRGISAFYNVNQGVLTTLHWPKKLNKKLPLKSESECRKIILSIKAKLEPARFLHIHRELFTSAEPSAASALEWPRATIEFEDRPNGFRMIEHNNGIGISIDRRTGDLMWIGMNTTTKVEGTTVRMKQSEALAICRPLVAAEYKELEREMDVNRLVIKRYQVGYATPKMGFASGLKDIARPPYRLKLCAVVDLVLKGSRYGPYIRVFLDAATKKSLGGEVRYADPEG